MKGKECPNLQCSGGAVSRARFWHASLHNLARAARQTVVTGRQGAGVLAEEHQGQGRRINPPPSQLIIKVCCVQKQMNNKKSCSLNLPKQCDIKARQVKITESPLCTVLLNHSRVFTQVFFSNQMTCRTVHLNITTYDILKFHGRLSCTSGHGPVMHSSHHPYCFNHVTTKKTEGAHVSIYLFLHHCINCGNRRVQREKCHLTFTFKVVSQSQYFLHAFPSFNNSSNFFPACLHTYQESLSPAYEIILLSSMNTSVSACFPFYFLPGTNPYHTNHISEDHGYFHPRSRIKYITIYYPLGNT